MWSGCTVFSRVCSLGLWPPAGRGDLESKAAVPFLDTVCAGQCEECQRREGASEDMANENVGFG